MVNRAGEEAPVSDAPGRVAAAALAEAIQRAGYDVPHETRELAISGMTCATCAGRGEKALLAVPGVVRAEVNLASEKASVEGIAGVLRPADLLVAAQRAGYDAELRTGDVERDRQIFAAEEDRLKRETRRVLAAAVLSVPLLLPVLRIILPRWLQLAVATPVQFLIA